MANRHQVPGFRLEHGEREKGSSRKREFFPAANFKVIPFRIARMRLE
jgi:hypothetical protein